MTSERLSDLAARHDAQDPAPMRDAFELPAGIDGRPVAYFAGNSLGLLPKDARTAIARRVDQWSTRAVTGWFTGNEPWQDMAASLQGPMSKIVGAHSDEVTVMNSLTVNLHLLMGSFYRPDGHRGGGRNVILIEGGAFPSDDYAVTSQIRRHGLDPATVLHRVDPAADGTVTTEAVVRSIELLGDRIGLVLLGAVNFRTGYYLEIDAITSAAHAVGAPVIWDLAHAAGNVELSLHDSNVDAAAWCNYKYLNGGPGAVGSLFLHRRHHTNDAITFLDGWWGNNSATRFAMAETIDRAEGAAGLQISTPHVLSMAALGPSLHLFEQAGGMAELGARSRRLTAFLEAALATITPTHRITQLTTRDPARRGAQISVIVDDAAHTTERLIALGVVPDDRPPNIVRFAPVPLSTTYAECARAVEVLASILPQR